MFNLQVERLKQLPQRREQTWQGGLVRLPGWVTEQGDKPFRPVAAMWVIVETGKVRLSEAACREEDCWAGGRGKSLAGVCIIVYKVKVS